MEQVVFLTVNHRGPLPFRELHSTDEIRVWRDPGGSWACFFTTSFRQRVNSPWQSLWQTGNVFMEQHLNLFCFLTLLHQQNMSMERPASGCMGMREMSWASSRPVSDCQGLSHTHVAYDWIITTPETRTTQPWGVRIHHAFGCIISHRLRRELVSYLVL